MFLAPLSKVSDVASLRWSFVVENSCLFVVVVVVIPDEFESCSFYTYEELIWDFDGNCIEFIDCFWQDGQFY